MNKSRKNIWIALIVVVIAVAGFVAYRQIAANRAASESSATETAIVLRGDLSITVEAAGSLAPPTEFTLAFPVAGKIYEVLVVEGQAVKQGDVLARLEDNFQAEGDFQALFTPAGVAQADGEVARAQIALDDAKDYLIYLISWDVYYAETKLAEAQAALDAVNADPTATEDAKAAAEKNVKYAQLNLRAAQIKYVDEYCPLYFTYTWIDDVSDEEITDVLPPTAADITLARADLESARVALADAQAALEIVKAGPSALQSPLTALGKEMARLEGIRQKMENTRLTAPADGVVTALFFQAGEYANPGAPVVTLSDLAILEAEVNLDETDVVRIALGMPVVITVDAFPGVEVSGEVIAIALTANVQSGVVLYPVTVRLDPTDLPLRSGMTVNVTFTIEERKDTLIVPFRAVETEGGQAYVTRVTGSGSERVAVTLGLITDTKVEILSGIEEGDVVTVYANPVQDAELMSNPMFGGGK
ncbi:MAG: HlyD family secretion protein [Anaerolineaceae bacterium]|nr:MAG: HlyD family secretion protein [Anaerolineaceae bacterium]